MFEKYQIETISSQDPKSEMTWVRFNDHRGSEYLASAGEVESTLPYSWG
jgi:hypothetical protein